MNNNCVCPTNLILAGRECVEYAGDAYPGQFCTQATICRGGAACSQGRCLCDVGYYPNGPECIPNYQFRFTFSTPTPNPFERKDIVLLHPNTIQYFLAPNAIPSVSSSRVFKCVEVAQDASTASASVLSAPTPSIGNVFLNPSSPFPQRRHPALAPLASEQPALATTATSVSLALEDPPVSSDPVPAIPTTHQALTVPRVSLRECRCHNDPIREEDA